LFHHLKGRSGHLGLIPQILIMYTQGLGLVIVKHRHAALYTP
jgi:hypothetical protein